jgi:hypothetical protein
LLALLTWIMTATTITTTHNVNMEKCDNLDRGVKLELDIEAKNTARLATT